MCVCWLHEVHGTWQSHCMAHAGSISGLHCMAGCMHMHAVARCTANAVAAAQHALQGCINSQPATEPAPFSKGWGPSPVGVAGADCGDSQAVWLLHDCIWVKLVLGGAAPAATGGSRFFFHAQHGTCTHPAALDAPLPPLTAAVSLVPLLPCLLRPCSCPCPLHRSWALYWVGHSPRPGAGAVPSLPWQPSLALLAWQL